MKMEQGDESTICLKNRSLLSLIRVGLTVAKNTKIGHLPVKFQFGIEKSAVRQDDFGQDWQIKLNIIPVIPALVKKPLF